MWNFKRPEQQSHLLTQQQLPQSCSLAVVLAVSSLSEAVTTSNLSSGFKVLDDT